MERVRSPVVWAWERRSARWSAPTSDRWRASAGAGFGHCGGWELFGPRRPLVGRTDPSWPLAGVGDPVLGNMRRDAITGACLAPSIVRGVRPSAQDRASAVTPPSQLPIASSAPRDTWTSSAEGEDRREWGSHRCHPWRPEMPEPREYGADTPIRLVRARRRLLEAPYLGNASGRTSVGASWNGARRPGGNDRVS